MARPLEYAPEVGDTILERLAGGETLSQICRSDGMPARATVMRWTVKVAAFRDAYAHARAQMFEHWADEIVEIADDGTNDWVTRERKNGSVEMVADREVVSRSTLRVDARKWLLSKLMPQRYGDRVALTGADGGPLQIQAVRFAEVLGPAVLPQIADGTRAPNLPQVIDNTGDEDK